jgi:hypothetical protein
MGRRACWGSSFCFCWSWFSRVDCKGSRSKQEIERSLKRPLYDATRPIRMVAEGCEDALSGGFLDS